MADVRKMITINLTPEQAGQSTITLSAAQLAAIHQQEASPPVTPPSGTSAASFPLDRLSVDDKKYLLPMMWKYRLDLKSKPGTHQLLEDMLTDSRGKTVWQGANIQLEINRVKNAISAGGDLYDPGFNPAAYAGPLKAVYANLVASKL